MADALAKSASTRSAVEAVCLSVSGVNHPTDEDRIHNWLRYDSNIMEIQPGLSAVLSLNASMHFTKNSQRFTCNIDCLWHICLKCSLASKGTDKSNTSMFFILKSDS